MRPDLLGRLAMGSTHKTIYVPDIQSIRIPLPPLEEQDQLVEWTWQRLHRIDAATDAISRQVELLAERRQALITAAATGQLAIPGVAA
jgi:type I restriction enzyme S subunit